MIRQPNNHRLRRLKTATIQKYIAADHSVPCICESVPQLGQTKIGQCPVAHQTCSVVHPVATMQNAVFLNRQFDILCASVRSVLRFNVRGRDNLSCG